MLHTFHHEYTHNQQDNAVYTAFVRCQNGHIRAKKEQAASRSLRNAYRRVPLVCSPKNACVRLHYIACEGNEEGLLSIHVQFVYAH